MTEKRKKKDKNVSIEELYRNKNFIPPKEKNLETIFEEPRKSKDGRPILTSVKKFKRYLHFDTTIGKIQKRKLKARKCAKKMKSGNLKTRSSTKVVECPDISLYISEVLGESSDSEYDDDLDFKNNDISVPTAESSGILKRKLCDSDNKLGGSSRTMYKKPCLSISEESELSRNLFKDSQINLPNQSDKTIHIVQSSEINESILPSEAEQTVEKEFGVHSEEVTKVKKDEVGSSFSSCIMA